MADYTNYNHGSSSKGTIAALIILAALVVGILLIASNAPPAPEGAVTGNAGAAAEVEPTPATPAVTE